MKLTAENNIRQPTRGEPGNTMDACALFARELGDYYSAPPRDIAPWEQELHRLRERHPGDSEFRHKARGYAFMAEHCPVHVFRHGPFFFELNTGRARTDLGTGGLGGWLKRSPFGTALHASSREWLAPCEQSGLSVGWPVLDDNHHTVSYEKALRVGLRGVIAEAERELARASIGAERDFLEAAIAGNQALIRIAGRFAAEAERLVAAEPDPVIRARLQQVATTARRVPAEPADSFHEALCVILFIFYVLPSVEGNGLSVFGHVDRLLSPFYGRDLAAGRLTPDEAADLISLFLVISDARYGMRSSASPWHVGTNGTLTVGGCDREGAPVFNALTRLLIEQHRALRLIDPKLNARITPRHPPEYFELLAQTVADGGNVLAIFNDDVVIPANAEMGKAIEDARLYVGGGCQENVLENCEVNSRATIYLNLAQVFLMGFFPEKWAFFFERAGFGPERYEGCASYADLHAAFLRNLHAVVAAHAEERNRTEREGVRYNPCPLHSSLLDDCLARRADMMAGGCRYSFGSVSLTGIGTVIDSLQGVKTAVYDRRLVSLAELGERLAANFEGQEAFRQFLIRQAPKFGQETEEARDFSRRVFADVAQAASDMPNSRGGRYEASLFSFRSFTHFGAATGATPDGRRAGELLSPGMAPSPLALGAECSIGQVLSTLEPLDLTRYPVVAVLDVTLPNALGGIPAFAIVAVIRRFLASGGSVLQVNCVDAEALRDARRHPERHPDLVVRVSGYSSVFVRLAEPIQDEIISRSVSSIRGATP
jgi:pyruvate-formate lyase